MSDCCEAVEFTDPISQVVVDDDCTVVVEVDGVGPQGPPGTAATVAVGTTTTLAPGSPATVANSGTASAAVLDFGIPEGQQGIQGIQGIQGPQGIQGVPGNAATIAVGTTSTLAPGSPATVANSGTSSAAIFDFGIPEGVQGLTGDTGVEIAAVAPTNLAVLWLDTVDPAIASLAVNVLSDFVAPYSYIGVAVSGAATSSPVWRVTRIDVGPPVVSQVADPIEWDDRLTAVYV
jgi:hypothetical protein